MAGFQVFDWDNAYENGGNIVGSSQYLQRWPVMADEFRKQVDCQVDVTVGGTSSRYDKFNPNGESKGLFVFVHGGYWQATEKGIWSHLAKGAVDRGWTAVLPGYDLCPAVSVANIVEMVGAAIEDAAANTSGPIVLTGHSAGGHLVAEMCAVGTPLSAETVARICHLVPLSGLFDLRPLLGTKLNDALKLDWQGASGLSPVLKRPIENLKLTAWVGGGERSEFLRQNRLIVDMWRGLGSWTQAVEEPDRHHFSVVEGLMDANSPLMHCIFGEHQSA